MVFFKWSNNAIDTLLSDIDPVEQKIGVGWLPFTVLGNGVSFLNFTS